MENGEETFRLPIWSYQLLKNWPIFKTRLVKIWTKKVGKENRNFLVVPQWYFLYLTRL